MTTAQQQFLELLRAGLWGTPAVPEHFSPEGTDWKAILRIAKEQTVLIIVADGIETLPKEFWPPKEMMLKIMMVRVKTAQMHQLMNATINQVIKALDAEGIPSVLLKGQGVAQNYRKPESRSCGDIDLYVGEENYKRACVIVENLDKDNPKHKLGIESDHHMHLSLNGIEIELHRFADYTQGKRQSDKIKQWTRMSIDQNFDTEKLAKWDDNGTPINLPPHTYNSLFIIHHAMRHMIKEGIGLRQICDWAMLLHRYHSEIDETLLQEKLNEFRLESVWNIFGRFAVNFIGLSAEQLPLSGRNVSVSKVNAVLVDIFNSGNFGNFDADGKDLRKGGYIKRKWRSFRFKSSRLFKLITLFPSYTIPYGFNWLVNGIYVAVRGK